MASFGDQYNYQVIFGVGNAPQVVQAVDQVSASTSRAAKSANQAAAATQRLGGGGRIAAQNLTQLTYVIDDMQYGVRGLMNQIPMITTALFGFGTAGAAAGVAGTILAGVFRKQIDGALAWAGVLDENVVKGLQKGAEATESYEGKVESLGLTLSTTTRAARDFVDAIKGEDIQDSALEAALVSIVARGTPLRNALQKAEADVEAVRDRVEQLNAMGEAGADVFAAMSAQLKQLEAAEGAVKAVHDELAAFVAGGVTRLREELAKGGDAAQGVLGQLKAIPDQSPEVVAAIRAIEEAIRKVEVDRIAKGMAEAAKAADEAKDFADALLEGERKLQQAQNERFAEAEKHRQEEVRQIFEVMAAEQAAEDERQRRVMDRRQAADRARLDDRTRRVVEAFGPLVQGGIQQGLQAGLNRGQSVDQAGDRTFAELSALLRRMGVEGGAADQAARQLVDEQALQFRAMVDADNARAALQREMLGGMRLMLNLFNQQRDDDRDNIRAFQALRDQAARNAIRRRANGLGNFRPF